MFFRMMLGLGTFLFRQDMGGGGGDVGAALDAAGASADAHIANETGGGAPPAQDPPGYDPPVTATRQQGDQGGDQGDMQYRDAAALRQELASSREKWKPLDDAFGQLSDQARSQVLQAVPTLGDDLALITSAFANMHPEDRLFLAQIAQMAPQDPIGAATLMAEAAGMMRGDDPGQGGQGDPGEYDPGDGPEPEYMTREDFQQALEQHETERAVHQDMDSMVGEMKQLGYDPFSTDEIEQVKVEALIAMARRTPGGDLAKAHESLAAWTQQGVDRFVDGKRVDARRPGPPDGGAPPSGERQLESLGDAEAAMRNRMDAEYGPSRTAQRR